MRKEDLIGCYLNCYSGYSLNPKIRYDASSGGLITSILNFMFEKNLIDGALVVRTKKTDPLKAEFFVARNPKEIIFAKGSKYCPVDMVNGLKDVIATKKNERLAVVGLPCHIKAFKKIKEVDKKTVLYLGLFCSRTPCAYATWSFLKKKRIKPKDVLKLSYRGEGWPGHMKIIKKNGKKILIPSPKVWSFIGSDFFISKKCFFCNDKVSELADISFGDAWLSEFRKNNKGVSLLISRPDRGQKILEEAIKDNIISLSFIEDRKIILSQLVSIYLKKKIMNIRRFLFKKSLKNKKLTRLDFLDFVLSVPSLLVFLLSQNAFFKKITTKMPFGFFSFYNRVTNKLYFLKARHDFNKILD